MPDKSLCLFTNLGYQELKLMTLGVNCNIKRAFTVGIESINVDKFTEV